jgi:arylsulfatase A-like enzyme
MSQAPNILLITTDQQRFDTINAAGNPHILTPNLNFLCDQGMRFTRAYSDCPVCMPARATILTGRHGYTNKLTDNIDAVDPVDPQSTVAGLLTRAGYQTRLVGKTHFPKFRVNYGFEHVEPCDDYYRHMARHPEKGVPMDHGLGQNNLEPGIATVSESDSLTHWTVDRSVEFLETRDASRPFFLWTSFTKPHPPLDPCLNYWQLYQNRSVPEPVHGDWSRSLPENSAFKFYTDVLNPWPERFSEETLRDVRRAYYACITQIDYNLGKLFARLREMGQLDNTWIIFTSDHGEFLGDHGLGAKMLPLEASAHVPFLVRPPTGTAMNERRGTTSGALITLADILPTAAAMAGVEVPENVAIDGIDLLSVVEGQQAGREEVFFQCGELHGLLSGQWKYAFADTTEEELLFNLESDPEELTNLAEQSKHKAERDRLHNTLMEHLKATDHPCMESGEFQHRPVPAANRGVWPGHHSIGVPSDVLH